MLEEMGIEFEVMPADIDEKAIRHDDPKELVLGIANAKADFLLPKITEPAILITGDAIVLCAKKVLEKPKTKQEVRDFLQGYKNYPAQTITAVVVTNTSTGKRAEVIDTSKVYFNNFSETEIDAIINDGQVFDLSGGFTIEGSLWEKHVDKIEGTRDSVIGLPKDITERLIDEVMA